MILSLDISLLKNMKNENYAFATKNYLNRLKNSRTQNIKYASFGASLSGRNVTKASVGKWSLYIYYFWIVDLRKKKLPLSKVSYLKLQL